MPTQTFKFLFGLTLVASACAPQQTTEWESNYDGQGKCETQAHATQTKFPVYFAHGFKATGEGWDGVRQKLEEKNPVWKSWAFAGSVDLAAAVSKRASDLRRNLTQVLAELEQNPPPDGEPYWKINIMAHSMGGLDSRYLINHPPFNNPTCHTLELCKDTTCASPSQCAKNACCTDSQGQPEPCCSSNEEGAAIFWRDRIASVTTLSTPHHGSSVADVGNDLIGTSIKKSNLTTALLAQTIGAIFGPDLPDKSKGELLDDAVGTALNLSMKFSREEMAQYREPDSHRIYSWNCAMGDPAACESYPPACDFPNQWNIRLHQEECDLGIQAACDYLKEAKEIDFGGCQLAKEVSTPEEEDLPQRRDLPQCTVLPKFADGPLSQEQAALAGECYKLPPPKPGLPPIFSWAGATCTGGPFGGSIPFFDTKRCGDLLNPGMYATYGVIRDVEGICDRADEPCYAYNDGIVSVNSASYGIFMGVMPADHFNWTTMDGVFSDIYSKIVAPPEYFYFTWLDRLAEAGY